MSHHEPRITVVLPVYNGAQTVGLAIESLLHQTFQDFELLILNDGSTDDSAQVIAAYQDPRIRSMSFLQRRGLVARLNQSLRLGRGKVHARMDHDDWAIPTRLAEQYAIIRQDPQIGLVSSAMVVCDAQLQPKSLYPSPTDAHALILHLANDHVLSGGTLMYRPETIRALGGFGAQDAVAEDVVLSLKASRFTRMGSSDKPLLYYRRSPVEDSRSAIDTLDLALLKDYRLWWHAIGGVDLSDAMLPWLIQTPSLHQVLSAPKRLSAQYLPAFKPLALPTFWAVMAVWIRFSKSLRPDRMRGNRLGVGWDRCVAQKALHTTQFLPWPQRILAWLGLGLRYPRLMGWYGWDRVQRRDEPTPSVPPIPVTVAGPIRGASLETVPGPSVQ